MVLKAAAGVGHREHSSGQRGSARVGLTLVGLPSKFKHENQTVLAANWTIRGLSDGAVVNSMSLDFSDATNESAMIIGVKATSAPYFRTRRRNDNLEYRTIGALIFTKSPSLRFRSKSSTMVSGAILVPTLFP